MHRDDQHADGAGQRQHGGGVIAQAQQDPDLAGAQRQQRRRRHPAAHHVGGAQREDPAEPQAAGPADDAPSPPATTPSSAALASRNALNVPPQRRASAIATKPSASSDGSFTCDDSVIRTAPTSSMPSGAHAAQSARCRGQRSGRGTSGPRRVDAAQRELGAGQHQAQHQRLVVDAGDQMHDQQRVGRAQPQRADLGDAAAAGQPRRRPHDQADPDQHHQPVAQHGGDDVLARSAPRCRGRSTGTAGRRAPASPATGWAPTG